jgi:hypothetical protein
MTRILFVNPNVEDYAADGMFHGLRTLLGDDAIDFPKAEYLYDTVSDAARGRIRGHGFTLYGLLPDIPVDRDHCLGRALAGEFDVVVFGDIWRTFGLFTEWGPQLADAGVRIAILDGSDRIEPYPFAGEWWRRRAWWFVPRAHTRGTYFKREVTPWTRWFASYLALPPPLNAMRMRAIRPLSFSIPGEKIVALPPVKTQEFATHVVDEEVAARIWHPTSYAFADEEEYRLDLQRSRFGITVKREGWDALRHYEIAAAGCVPCFRDLARKPATCAPHGLVAGVNCIAYADADDLLRQTAAIDDETYERLQRGALAWAEASSTVNRAREFLAALGLDVAEPAA